VKLRTYNYVVVVTTQANLGGNVGGMDEHVTYCFKAVASSTADLEPALYS